MPVAEVLAVVTVGSEAGIRARTVNRAASVRTDLRQSGFDSGIATKVALRLSLRRWLQTQAFLLIVELLVSSPRWLGFSLFETPLALDTVASMGAKLGCSGRHLSGFSLERIKSDVESYSATAGVLSYREEGSTMFASAFGNEASATFRPGLGCTLNLGDTSTLDHIELLAVAPDSSLPLRTNNHLQSLVDELLQQDNAAGLDTRALVVVHKGAVATASYGEGINADTPLLGWSMGKSVTAMLIGRAAYLGKPLLEDVVPFPEWSGDARNTIRLGHLLTMTSGLDLNETYVVGTDSTRMLFLDPLVVTRPIASPYGSSPGQTFYYSSGTTNLLTTLLQRHLGSPQALYTFFDEELRKPLGLAHTTLEPDAGGTPRRREGLRDNKAGRSDSSST